MPLLRENTLRSAGETEKTTSSLTSSKKCVSMVVQKMIQFLKGHDEAQRYGIVFVEQRATVAVLNELLSTHPMTRAIVKCSTFVGTSANSSRKTAVGEWLDSSQQQDTLIDFRRQERNLIIATSVLEEGIDISACNTVICFNKSANLKSFIQRRGRARKKESIFVLMLSSEDESVGPNRWEALEREMTETYQQDAADRSPLLASDIKAFIRSFSQTREYSNTTQELGYCLLCILC